MTNRAPAFAAGRDPLFRFFALSAALFTGWYLLYSLLLKPNGALDHWVIDQVIAWATAILRILGYRLIPEPANVEQIRTIGVEGGHLLWIGDPCNGVGLFAVFSLFIIAYPGPWRHKLWFIPLGVITIHLINAIRVAALCIVVTIDYELLNFNHDYTFYVVVYGWVFLLWYIWVQRFARLAPTPTAAP